MYKLVIGLVCAAMAVQTAAADIVDLFGTATWSFNSGVGSNGPNFAFNRGSQISNLIFSLSGIPVGATINSATLTILNVSTSWDFGANAGNVFGCAPPSGALPFFGEALFCSDLQGAEFMDTVGVDGTVPNTCGFDCPGPIQLFGFPPGSPEPVDPLAVKGSAFTIPIFASASSSFGAFDDFRSGTPPIPSFTISGFTDAELDIDFSGGHGSVAPEPANYSIVLAGLLIPVGVLAFRRKRQSGSSKL